MTREIPVPKGTALAKFEGRIFFSESDVPFEYFMESPTVTVGRSDPVTVFQDPLLPAQEGIDVGLGDSNKLSRRHARIEYDRTTQSFLLYCLGKNGLTVTEPDALETVIMTPDTTPVPLHSRTLIQMGDCVFVFLLPAEYPARPKKRREWIKAENVALRTLMMRLGYGRWDVIVKNATGRLSERDPEELIPVARKFVARCFIHARPGVEQKVLSEILREDVPEDANEEEANADVDALVEEAKQLAEPGEKRKYVRWARKLRLLRRLRDVHDHSSLDRLRTGGLRVFTPPPAKYWTCADDADLILGTYLHGYGSTEAIRCDETLGFYKRFSPQLSTSKKGNGQDKAVKARASLGCNGDDDDHDDDHEDDDDDFDGPENEMNGESSAKKAKKEEDAIEADGRSNSEIGDSNVMDTVGSPKAGSGTENNPAKKEAVEVTPQKEDSEAKVAENQDAVLPADVAMEDSRSDVETKKFGNGNRRKSAAEGTNTDEFARRAASEAAGEDGRVPFPSSESLMRRLKSIIHSCAKEFERGQRELRKQSLAQSRAQRRRNELAHRKAEKNAEKQRLREARRIAKSQPFSKKDAAEFERALSNFGLVYKEDGTTVNWQDFIDRVPSFRSKYFTTLDDALAEFNRESSRVIDIEAARVDEDAEQLNELSKDPQSTLFTQLTNDRAERVRERILFFRTLRGEVLHFPALSSILRGMKRTKELPIWWRSHHDRALLCGVNIYGLNNWDAVARDPDLAFSKSMESYNRKFASDPKSLKRGVFPKANSLVKRAQALVVYFRAKAADPVYQQLARETNGGELNAIRDMNGRGRELSHGRRESDHSGSRERAGSVMSAGTGEKCSEWQEENSVVVKPKAEPAVKRETILNITDESGALRLPANLGDGLWLIQLGKIVATVEFHTDKTLYPVGYQSVRQMGSNFFMCEIAKTEDGTRPVFRVCVLSEFSCEGSGEELWSEADLISEGNTIGSVWLNAANQFSRATAGGVDLASGAERFGLYEPTVIHHMQQLPGAQECELFRFRDFTRQGAGAVVVPPVGILAAMTGALSIARKRNAESLSEEEEMEIPDAWASSYGGKRKRRKSSSYWG